TLTTWLSEAQTALHEVSIGKRTVTLALGDKRVSFSPADVRALRAHISQIQTAIAIATGNTTGSPVSVATWTR
ncbi:MAG: gpW family head-tail joining protein, partial [Candidatus Contendobacter sp.]|nr:gpW family head-tail joining protein [Candidatus Contendobacter sp.]